MAACTCWSPISSFQLTTTLPPRPLKAEVGHHGGHQELIRQLLLVLKHRPPEEQDMVAVHDTAPTINGRHPISITIESEPIALPARSRPT